MVYNWQLPNWPHFVYELNEIQHLIVELAEEVGQVNGILLGLPEDLKQETLLQIMLSEAVKTSEIEGEYISREDVMSSIRNNLGLNHDTALIKDKRAGGIAQLMIATRRSFDQPLSLEMLCNWHSMLMANVRYINPGQFRKGEEPMQVISGSHGNEMVHFEAPPSVAVPQEMEHFVTWYNNLSFTGSTGLAEAIQNAAIAHLYFETIHPFEDGNGRIGRAIAEKALSQSLGRPVMLSLSKIIEADRSAYYAALKEAQRSLEITSWISYFALVVLSAQRDAKELVEFTLKKAQFFDGFRSQLNDRQLKAINKMMDKGGKEFEGGMTARKYIGINKTSKATATRDLQHLQEIGV
ncbi:Fic family protein [Pedobacter sp. UYP24]